MSPPAHSRCAREAPGLGGSAGKGTGRGVQRSCQPAGTGEAHSSCPHTPHVLSSLSMPRANLIRTPSHSLAHMLHKEDFDFLNFELLYVCLCDPSDEGKIPFGKVGKCNIRNTELTFYSLSWSQLYNCHRLLYFYLLLLNPGYPHSIVRYVCGHCDKI